MKVTSLGLALSTLLVLNACGKSSSSKNKGPSDDFNGSTIVYTDVGDLEISKDGLSGSGSFLYKDPLGETSTNKNYAISFSLKDKGSLELVTHSNNKLEKGVSLRFTRSGKNLKFNYAGTDLEKALLNDVTDSTDIKLSIDVHNKETPTHVLVWNADQADKDEDNSLFNSDADVDATAKGGGTFLGFILKDATLKTVTIEGAANNH